MQTPSSSTFQTPLSSSTFQSPLPSSNFQTPLPTSNFQSTVPSLPGDKWEKCVDGKDTWYISSSGKTSWTLPPGAILKEPVFAW